MATIQKLIIVFTILSAFSGTAWSDGTIPPVESDHPLFAGSVDRRPQIPFILELMSPMIKDVAICLSKQLPPSSPPHKCAELLNLIAAELHNAYLLSMSTHAVPKEAEETYIRVKKLQEQIKQQCK